MEHGELLAAIHLLDAREALVLRARFGLDRVRPRTLQDVGNELGVTRERVRQIEGDALRHCATLMSEARGDAGGHDAARVIEALRRLILPARPHERAHPPAPARASLSIAYERPSDGASYGNARRAWGTGDNQAAARSYQAGVGIEQLAESLGRSPSAVLKRLVRLGVITEGERERYRNRPPRVRKPRRR